MLCVPGGRAQVLLRGTLGSLEDTAVTLCVQVLTFRCTRTDDPFPSCQDPERM